jgi:hypothetical protein
LLEFVFRGRDSRQTRQRQATTSTTRKISKTLTVCDPKQSP